MSLPELNVKLRAELVGMDFAQIAQMIEKHRSLINEMERNLSELEKQAYPRIKVESIPKEEKLC